MGRPTNEKKDRVLKIRVSDELYEKLEKESEGNMSGYIRGVLSGERKCNTELGPENYVVQNQESVPSEEIMTEETYKDLEQMCKLSGLSVSRFMDYVRVLFNEGKIYIDGLVVKTKGEYDLSYLLDVCHRVNVDPQEMINKLANSLVRR